MKLMTGTQQNFTTRISISPQELGGRGKVCRSLFSLLSVASNDGRYQLNQTSTQLLNCLGNIFVYLFVLLRPSLAQDLWVDSSTNF